MTYDTINDAVTRAGGAGALLAGHYSIVRLLGNGGMGNVWLAEDTQLDNKLFAIKMLPSIMVNNKRAYVQLKAEALVAMRLVHPNIVQIRAFEENDGNPFLVMDYIDGQTLDDYLAEHTGTTGVSPVGYGSTGTTGILPVDVLRILRPIAAALDYAHAKGVVHRDVKPGNVMIAKDGTPYILDFGIARETQETMTRVTGKLSSGTLLYMSPEQLMGEPPKPAQDIYSFAAMAYECLKGEPPFVRGAIEDQIKNKQPAPPPGGTQLVASVMAGLAKKPENRPATCAEVLEGTEAPSGPQGDDFSRVEHVERVEGGNGRARSSSGPQSGGPRPVAVLKGILVAALGLAIIAGLLWFDGRAWASAKFKSEWERRELRGAEAGDNGHTKVQLWKGGPYWADTNIGAEKPWDYGYYFWWGDTMGYKWQGHWVASTSNGFTSGFSFDNDTTPTRGKSIDALKSGGWITAEGVLAPKHDAAHVQWGGGWRIPTQQELNDLHNKCDWKWTTVNGVNGYVIRGRDNYDSASLFLPCAGYGGGTSLNYSGSLGFYWSSVPYSDSYHARGLYFYSGNHLTYYSNRYYGFSVRPVQGFAK